MADQRTKVVILDTIREGLVLGDIKSDGTEHIVIIMWAVVDTLLSHFEICNDSHPVQWIREEAYSVTLYDLVPGDVEANTLRHLGINSWTFPREGADPYMIRFAFDELTGSYYIKERLERG